MALQNSQSPTAGDGGLVAGRSKRSTAGNRMQALLDQQVDLEEEELFKEEDNDIEFANAEEQEDIFDSDFGDSTDDEAQQGSDGCRRSEDQEAGERELEEEEFRRKKAARKQASNRTVFSIVRRPKLAAQSTSASTGQSRARSEVLASRRDGRISFASEVDDSSDLVANRRVSSRRATRQSAVDTQHRLQEAEARRLQHPMVRNPPKQNKRPSLNQAELIELALEREEENRKSLREWMEGEEERKRQELARERRQQPFSWIRWRSVRSRVPKVQQITDSAHVNQQPQSSASATIGRHETENQEPKQEQADVSPDITAADGQLAAQSHELRTASIADEVHGNESGDAIIERLRIAVADAESTISEEPDILLPKQSPDGQLELDAAGDQVQPRLSMQGDRAQEERTQITKRNLSDENQTLDQPMGLSSTLASDQPKESPRGQSQGEEQEFLVLKQLISSRIDFTLDPVLRAREQSAANAAASNTNHSGHTEDSGNGGGDVEFESRNYVSLHYSKSSPPSWVEQWNVLFGTHSHWASTASVPSRNRPLRPRASVCPITGRMARYRDSKTGVAFANVAAAKILAHLFDGGNEWFELTSSIKPSDAYREDCAAQTSAADRHESNTRANVAKKSGARKSMRAKDSLGRSNGFLTGFWMPSREHWITEPLATEADNVSRASAGRKRPSPTSVLSPRPKMAKVWTGISQARGTSSSSDLLRNAGAQKAEPRSSISDLPPQLQHLGVAPGDEQAVLARALQIPEGTTRSGRARGSLGASSSSGAQVATGK